MKHKKISGLILASLLSYSATAISADDYQENRFYVAPMASYGFFDEESFDPDNELGVQLSLGKTLTNHLALELYAFHFDEIESENNNTSGSLSVTGYGLSALLFPARDVLPIFALVGVGAGEHDFSDRGSSLDDLDSDFYDIGLGFLTPISDFGVAIRGEYRFRNSDIELTGSNQELESRDHIFSLGLQIPLGSRPQPEPEPVAPAPAPQPAQPLDDDGDGVPNRRDQCPGTPPGTKVDANGCPEVKKTPIVLKGVKFEFDSARLTRNAERRLDNVVNALRSSRNIDVRIEGHTDSIGNAAYNLKLSQSRADSVKTYLVNHGIASSRLVTKGYGETRPVAPNTEPDGTDNPEGRAKNRRVELHVIR